MVKEIITAIIRPTLEYGAVVQRRHLKSGIDKLESSKSKTATSSTKYELRR